MEAVPTGACGRRFLPTGRNCRGAPNAALPDFAISAAARKLLRGRTELLQDEPSV